MTLACTAVQAQLSNQVVTGTPIPQVPAAYGYNYGNANSNANYGTQPGYQNQAYPTPGYGNNYYGPSGSLPAPIISNSEPRNGDSGVNPNLRKITITFNQPMNTGSFYWPIPQNDRSFPQLQSDPYWTNGNQTLVMSVILYPGTQYRIPINISSPVFTSASGVPAAPGYLSFQTSIRGGSSVPLNAVRPGGSFGSSAARRTPTATYGIPTNSLNPSIAPSQAQLRTGVATPTPLPNLLNPQLKQGLGTGKTTR